MGGISRFVLSAGVNLAWQMVVIALAAWAGALLFRRSPAQQHRIWAAAFALCCLAPAASLPHYRVAGDFSRPFGPALPAHRPAPFSPDSAAGKGLLAAYLGCVVWAAARLARSWRSARKAAAGAAVVELPSATAKAVAEFQALLGLKTVEFRRSAAALAPFTFGSRKPAVVLPERLLDGEKGELLLAVSAHELAHIRRRDFLGNALIEALFPLLAFHPCAHWMRRRIRATRELACDATVAAGLLDAGRYAESLLSVTLETAALAPAASPGVGSVTSDDLEERIRRLMMPRRLESRNGWRVALSAVLLAVAAAGSGAYAFRPADPRDYTGVWRENWASAFRPGLTVDRNDCCFRTLEIRYENGRFQGALTSDSVSVEGNRVERAGRTVSAIENPVLEDGVLRFWQRGRALDEIYEVTLGPNGSALVRSHLAERQVRDWTVFGRVY